MRACILGTDWKATQQKGKFTMGLEKEIHELFERVVELDLERISRSAVPIYHWTTTPPPAMYEYQNPTGGSVTLVSQDYQVVGIELCPFGLTSPDLKSNMDVLRDRRSKRKLGTSSCKFESSVGSEKYDDAYDEYLEESNTHDPIPITPRDIDTTTDPLNPKATIISVAGVDYVHEKYLENETEYLKVIKKLTILPRANIDQWPEHVLLKVPGGVDDKYIRADVIYYEKDPQNPGHYKKYTKRLSP